MTEKLDLARYQDWTQCLAVFSTNGGEHVRGSVDDLQINDAEPVLGEREEERARLFAVVKLAGSRTTAQNSAEPSFGVVVDGAGTVVVTTERLIVMVTQGESQLGTVAQGEAHTFTLPWDLVTTLTIPARKSLADRIAGGRDITLFSNITFSQVSLNPVKKAEINGATQPITDDGVMNLLVQVAVENRLATSPAADHARLQAVQQGRYELEGKDRVAWIDDPDGPALPAHLVGRVVGHD